MTSSTPADPRVRALEAERTLLLHRLDGLSADFAETVAASRDSNADDEHDPEGATIAFERSQVTSMTRQLRRRLDEVDAALARVTAGSYGMCVDCGDPIVPARLQARPAAARCMGCASR